IAIGVPEGLGALCVLYFAFIIAQSISSYFEQWVLQLLGQRAMNDMRLAIYDRIPVGRLMTRMTNDIESINEMFAAGVVTLLADFVKLCAIVAIMLWM